jgi:carboxymethylenebutenolidase
MPTSTIDVTTPAGNCQTQIFTPDGAGPWPAVIVCFDAGGQRPAMSEIAMRIAKLGYLVALPDLYHRVGSILDILPSGAPRDAKAILAVFADQERRATWMTRYLVPAVDYDHLRSDVGALLDHLAQRRDVRGGVGTTGYCMGGNISLRLATIFGDRIAATASFHGGHLAGPAPDSPHLRADAIKSRVYIAGAIDDASFTDEMKQQLIAALRAARVEHTVETYPARHGFAVTDNPTFDAVAAERHYAALESLFAATLHT